MDPRLDEASARLDDLTQEVKLLRGTVSALRSARRRSPASQAPSRANLTWFVLGCLIAVIGLLLSCWIAAQCR